MLMVSTWNLTRLQMYALIIYQYTCTVSLVEATHSFGVCIPRICLLVLLCVLQITLSEVV